MVTRLHFNLSTRAKDHVHRWLPEEDRPLVGRYVRTLGIQHTPAINL
jgi:hypothetical protein